MKHIFKDLIDCNSLRVNDANIKIFFPKEMKTYIRLNISSGVWEELVNAWEKKSNNKKKTTKKKNTASQILDMHSINA